MTPTVILALAACLPDREVESVPLATITLPTTGHTPPPTGPTTPPPPGPPVPVQPRMVVFGDQGDALGSDVRDLGDVDGDGYPELAVRRLYDTAVLGLRPVDGTHLAESFLQATFGGGDLVAAGDTDHDGRADVWFDTGLFRGPFSGSYGWEQADVRILAGGAVVGDFDADGDGELDVALGGGGFQVHYGPFTEDRPGFPDPGFDPSTATVIDPGLAHSSEFVWRLGALNAPGELVFAVGDPFDAWDILAFDLRGSRGDTLGADDVIATFDETVAFDPIPDLDGDGLDDLLYRWSPLPKPISGWVDFPPDRLAFGSTEQVIGVDDVSGDGLADLTVEHRPDGATAVWYAVPGTVRGTDLDPSEIGALLVLPPDALQRDVLAVDLDLDGLAELIFSDPYHGDGGTLWVFSGAEIAASLAGG